MVQMHIYPLHLTNQQFFQFCQDNREMRLERTTQGDMIVMTPAGGETGKLNLSIGAQLWNWNHDKKLGIAFDSSTGFILPNGATRSPDAAWIPLARWDELSPNVRKRFLPLCPDFIVELRSPSDNLMMTCDKMQEYMQNGARLGWLIDPQTRQVIIYRQGYSPEILDNPATLSGEEVLPDFFLDVEAVWG